MSMPADDLRARRRVLTTLPLGITAVYIQGFLSVSCTTSWIRFSYNIQEPFSPRSPVPHGIGYTI